MVATRSTPPDLHTLDADALRAMIVAQHGQLQAPSERLRARDHPIERLKRLIAKLQRMQFGRKPEKVERQIEPLELKLEELETNRAESAPVIEQPAAVSTPAPATRPARRSLPEHLPRALKTHEPEQPCCPECGGVPSKLGEDVSEVLDYIPESFQVIRHLRPKLSCTACDGIVPAPAPSRPMERGIAGPALRAHVFTSKYRDHLPWHRQNASCRRQGVDREDSTPADWAGASSRLAQPLVEALRRYVLGGDKLHADDTPVPVLAPGNGKTKTGRLWTYVRDDRPAGDTAAPAVGFSDSPDRKGEHPQQHLRDFSGTLQAAAAAGFNQLYENGHIQEAACWAHVRRKFYELMEAHKSTIATEAVERITALYAIESEIRGRAPDERHQVRPARSRPLLDAICTVGWKHRCRSFPRSPTPRPRSATRSSAGK